MARGSNLQFVVVCRALSTVGFIVRGLVQLASVERPGGYRRVVDVKGTISLVILGLDESANSARGCARSGEDVFPLLGEDYAGDGDISAVQRAMEGVPAALWVLDM